jgi:sporulation related protein
VQVGAFKDAEAARRLAGKLRDENFKVEESLTRAAAAPAAVAKTPASETGTEQYAVFVSGASVEDVNRRLSGKGLTAEAAPGGGLVVKPPLALRDAVTLSKDLAVEGLKVQVRRAGAVTAAATAPNGAPALHRVRVGAFGDKSAALAAARELETKGYKPYIARGDQ